MSKTHVGIPVANPDQSSDECMAQTEVVTESAGSPMVQCCEGGTLAWSALLNWCQMNDYGSHFLHQLFITTFILQSSLSKRVLYQYDVCIS